jgi:hypothetical protein
MGYPVQEYKPACKNAPKKYILLHLTFKGKFYMNEFFFLKTG